MSFRENELIPVVPPEEHPYMYDLYARTGLDLNAGADQVLAAAQGKWDTAGDVGGRAETAELLLGRRIDSQELRALPSEFRKHMFNGGGFDGLLSIMSQIAQAEHQQ